MRLLIVALVCAASVARADVDGETAKRLFDEAIDDFSNNRIAAACPKLEASIRLRAEVKPLGLLAACYERQGKLATAYRTFKETRKKAEAANDNDSAVAAAGHVARLEPKVARVTITSSTPVTLDGKPFADVGKPYEIDAGKHKVSAAGFDKDLEIKDGDNATVVIPKADGVVIAPTEPTPIRAPSSSNRKLIGMGVLGGGVAFTAVGGLFGLQAKGKWDDAQSKHGCNDDGDCADQAGLKLIDSARSKGLVSTVFVGVGLVAVAGGVVLYLTAPKRTEKSLALTTTGRDVILLGQF